MCTSDSESDVFINAGLKASQLHASFHRHEKSDGMSKPYEYIDRLDQCIADFCLYKSPTEYCGRLSRADERWPDGRVTPEADVQ